MNNNNPLIKPLCICFVVLLGTLSAFSQITKRYISKVGKLTSDSTDIQATVFIEKINDTAYLVHQYDMSNILVVQGTFKDALLTNPNGEFSYYKIEPSSIQITFNFNNQKLDTIRTPVKLYIESRGRYLNGLKYGVWTEYYSNGAWWYVETFEADKKNGLYEVSYNKINKPSIVGSYKDDKRNGSWYQLSNKGDTMTVDYYKDNERVKTVSHLSEKKFQTHIKFGHPNYDLPSLLKRKLSKAYSDFFESSGTYKFTLTKDGKLTEPVVKNVQNLKFEKAIIDALLSFPDWKPTYIDKDAVQSVVEISIDCIKKNGEPFQLVVEPGFIIPGYNGY